MLCPQKTAECPQFSAPLQRPPAPPPRPHPTSETHAGGQQDSSEQGRVIGRQPELTHTFPGGLGNGEFPFTTRGKQTSAHCPSAEIAVGLCCGFLQESERDKHRSEPLFPSSRTFYKDVPTAGMDNQIWANSTVVTWPLIWRKSLLSCHMGV